MRLILTLLVAVLALCVLDSTPTPGQDNYRRRRTLPPELWGVPTGTLHCCFSLGQGSEQPISIASKEFAVRTVPGGKEASFDGQVKVKQGEVTLKCDRLTIVYGEDNAINAINAIWVSPVRNVSIQPQSFNIIRSITAAGNVEIVQNERMATAGKAQFDFVKRTLVLTEGPPQIWHCPDRMVAHTIVIDLDEECKVK